MLTILFDGIAYGMLLFVLAVGLSVTMGLMNFINLAHGAFACVGGYLTVVLMQRAGVPFIACLPLAFVAVGALVAVKVAVGASVAVNVEVGVTGVLVAVGALVRVALGIGVALAVAVGALVFVGKGVFVGGCVFVGNGVLLGTGVGCCRFTLSRASAERPCLSNTRMRIVAAPSCTLEVSHVASVAGFLNGIGFGPLMLPQPCGS